MMTVLRIAEQPLGVRIAWVGDGNYCVTDGSNNKKRKPAMTTTEKLLKVLEALPERRLGEVLDFARFVYWLERQEKEEFDAWHRFGQGQWDELYGPNEPEYTEADIKPEPNS
jgi:hypothetical protein